MKGMTFFVALALGLPLTAMFGWMFGGWVGGALGALTLAGLVLGWIELSRESVQALSAWRERHDVSAEVIAFPEDAWRALVRGQAESARGEHRLGLKLLLLLFSPAAAAAAWLWYDEGNPYALLAIAGVPLLYLLIATPARRRMRGERHRWLMSDRRVRVSEFGMSVGNDFTAFEKKPESIAVTKRHGCWMVVIAHRQSAGSETPPTPPTLVPFPPDAEAVARAWAQRLEVALNA